MGCDPSTHLSHKWAFSIVDKCIILEDDIVPSLSFFPFCIELLNRYEDDKRIDRICGMNLLGTYETGSDYFLPVTVVLGDGLLGEELRKHGIANMNS